MLLAAQAAGPCRKLHVGRIAAFREDQVGRFTWIQPAAQPGTPTCFAKRARWMSRGGGQCMKASSPSASSPLLRPPAPFATPPRSSFSPTSTKLCVALTGSSVEEQVGQAYAAKARGADLVEIRLDFLQKFEPSTHVAELLQACPLPSIVTCRPVWEGGKYEGTEESRLASLALAVQLHAPFVDVELLAAEPFFAGLNSLPASPTKVIVSSHNYRCTPPDAELFDVLAAARASGAAVAKLVTTATTDADAWRMLAALRASVAWGLPTIAFAMGERGQATRLLAGVAGGLLSFGTLKEGTETAPGQPSLASLRNVYRVQRTRRGSPVVGVVGRPVAHSKSPLVHNAALQAVGLDATYVPFLVDCFPDFIEALETAEFEVRGLSITLPHKEAALAAAREADTLAASIGAANTLVRLPEGGWKAYNTDCLAATAAIERGLLESGGTASASPLAGGTVVVLGAGGAGRAVAFGVASRGARVVVANRSLEKARALAKALPVSPEQPGAHEGVRLAELGAVGDADVLANSTSVGMNEDECPVPNDVDLARFRVVFDAVYTPLKTTLLQRAEAAGCTTVTGDAMFLGQAEAQFELFTGTKPPEGVMKRALHGAS